MDLIQLRGAKLNLTVICVQIQLNLWIFIVTLQLVKDLFFCSSYKLSMHSYMAFIGGIIQAKI